MLINSGTHSELPPPLSPFADVAALAPNELETYYDWVHAVDPEGSMTTHSQLWSAERENFPSRTYPVKDYADVGRLIASRNVNREVTLAPFPPTAKSVLRHPLAMAQAAPYVVRAMLLPKGTANATGEDHRRVTSAVFTSPDNTDPQSRGLSRRPDTMRTRYGHIISNCVEQSLDSLEAALRSHETVDLASVFASPLAARVISRVIGFPESEDRKLKGWSDAQTTLLGRRLSPRELYPGVRGLMELYGGCLDLVRERRRRPAADLASHIAQSDLTDEQVAAILMNNAAAGYSTEYGSNLNIVHRLLSDPSREYWHAFAPGTRNHDDIVQELLRLETALIGWKIGAPEKWRLTDGTMIPPYANLVLMLGAANRDPKYFPRPHDLRPGRSGQPLTFGKGNHLCMGKELALMQTKCVLLGLRERFPGLRLVGGSDHRLYEGPDLLFRTLSSLAVTIRPAAA